MGGEGGGGRDGVSTHNQVAKNRSPARLKNLVFRFGGVASSGNGKRERVAKPQAGPTGSGGKVGGGR